MYPSVTPALAHSSCAERDEWHSCLSRALPEDYKAQALAAFQHSVEVRGAGTDCTALHLPGAPCISFLQGPGSSSHLAQGSHCAAQSLAPLALFLTKVGSLEGTVGLVERVHSPHTHPTTHTLTLTHTLHRRGPHPACLLTMLLA